MSLIALAATALTLLALAPMASAAPKQLFDQFPPTVGSGSADGQFNEPWDVAIDQESGNVYVVDNGNDRVQVLDEDGNFLFKFGETGTGKGQFIDPRGIAIDQSADVLYVTDEDNLRVQKFDLDGNFLLMWGWGVLDGTPEFQVCAAAAPSCQAGISGSGDGQFLSTFSGQVAVAPDGSPNDGNVYVADAANERVQVFSAAGAFLSKFGSQGTGDGQFGSNWPRHLAIDSVGNVYASDSNSGSRVQKFDSTHAFIGTVADLLVAGTSGNDGLAVDPTNDHLFVLRDPNSGDSVVQEYDATGAQVADSPHGNGEAFNSNQGVAVNNSTGRIYLGRTDVDVIAVLDQASPPTATLEATDVAETSATLNATINPNGGFTTYQFQYRICPNNTCPGTGSFINVPNPPQAIGNGTTNVQITHELTGLNSNETYEVQLLVNGAGPAQTLGADATGDFTTPAVPPVIVDRPAAPVGETTAQLQASIDTRNAATEYRFEYVDDAAFQSSGYATATKVPVPDAELPRGLEPVIVFEQVSGLSPDTTYHFRVVANNGTGGDQVGADRTFTTSAAPTPGGPADREYELVSPADKPGPTGIGSWYKGIGSLYQRHGMPAYEGDRVAIESSFGANIIDAPMSYANDWAFAERQSDEVGWVSHSPHRGPQYGHAYARFALILTANPTLNRFSWGTNNEAMKVFPEMDEGFTNTPIVPLLSDWNRRWELFGWGTGSILISADGGTAVGVTGNMRGLAGPGDPTASTWPDLVDGQSIYLADTSVPLTDTFEHSQRTLVNVCTGSGAERTQLPTRLESGKLTESPCPAPGPGRDAHLVSNRGAALWHPGSGGGGSSRENVVSADGNRIFFVSPDPDAGPASCTGTDDETVCPPQLFVRQTEPDGSVIVRWISKAEEGLFGDQDASLIADVRFEGASTDGDKVFFRTAAPLTEDDPNGAGAPAPPGGVTTGTPSQDSWDVYMYDFPDTPGADPGDGTLTRISAGPTGTADCNSPQGGGGGVAAVRFLSDDGSRVYFTCSAPLPGVPAPGSGTITGPGGSPTNTTHRNLYAYDASKPLAERWTFVARLPRTGGVLSTCASTGVNRGSPFNGFSYIGTIELSNANTNCVRGSRDGDFIIFMTDARLTSDDPPSQATGDVYAYDLEADELMRISAPQGGAGLPAPCLGTGSLSCYGDMGENAFVTQLPQLNVPSDPAGPAERVVYFHSLSQLLPEDVDNSFDVYEWHDGKLSLISTGNSQRGGAVYYGNDRTGRNVYIATRDRLTWQDIDDVSDVYVARVGGGIPEPLIPPPCDVLADLCQEAASTPPPPPGAASSVFAGQGNVVDKGEAKRCPRGKVRRGNRCVPRRCPKGKVRRGKRCVKKRGTKRRVNRTANKTGRASR